MTHRAALPPGAGTPAAPALIVQRRATPLAAPAPALPSPALSRPEPRPPLTVARSVLAGRRPVAAAELSAPVRVSELRVLGETAATPESAPVPAVPAPAATAPAPAAA